MFLTTFLELYEKGMYRFHQPSELNQVTNNYKAKSMKKKTRFQIFKKVKKFNLENFRHKRTIILCHESLF